jgi:putative hydroxymethylpyrimidine transport system substrate-binding protein
MSRVAALLAAALLLGAVAGCGGDGAEPGAPSGATIVLDFVPNAVHSGIYTARARDFYRDAGIDLTIRQPGESTDAPKLLEAGRADFAILDIHDLGIAAERGLDVVGVMPLVQRPLASVIARGDGPVSRPRDLEGQAVGVTGLPSDDAVVDSEVSADGGDPAEVRRVTIGFNAVSSLAAGKVDAATGFWNAEGVALRRQGIPIRIFKVDRYGAPPYPELILTTSRHTLEESPELVEAVVAATTRGYRFTANHPSQAITDLLDSVPSLNPADQRAQLDALLPILRPVPFSYPVLRNWASWDVNHDLLRREPVVESLFRSPAG